MPGITLGQAQAQLDKFLQASLDASEAQSYSVGSGSNHRQVSKMSAKQIQENIIYWENKVKSLSGTRRGPSFSRVSLR